jgi:hypothetical protein
VLERVRVNRLTADEYPLVTKSEREAIPGAIAELKRSLAGSTPDHIASVLGMLSFALPKKHGGGDAEALITVYAKALNDIPPDVLDDAGLQAVKTLKFFPKVVELREIAMPEIYRRKWQLMALELLAQKYDREANAKPVKLVDPAQIAQLRQQLADRFPSARTG